MEEKKEIKKNNNEKKEKKKPTKKKKKKTNLAVRIMALTMAILMLLSSLSMVFAYF